MKNKMFWLWIVLIVVLVVGLSSTYIFLDHVGTARLKAKHAELSAAGFDPTPEFILGRRTAPEKNAWEAPITSRVIGLGAVGHFPDADRDAEVILGTFRGMKIEVKSGGRQKGIQAEFKIKELPPNIPRTGSDEEILTAWSDLAEPEVRRWLEEIDSRPEDQIPFKKPRKSLLSLDLPREALKMTDTLGVRAILHLRKGKSEAAFLETRLLLALARMHYGQRVMITELMATAIAQLSLNPLHEGLRLRSWSDAQLQTLESDLQKLGPLETAYQALHGERVVMMDFMQRYKHLANSGQNARFTLDNAAPRAKEFGLLLLPQGLYDSAACDLANLMQKGTMNAWDLKTRRLNPKAISNTEEAIRGLPAIFWNLLQPSVYSLAQRASDTDVELKLARLAIALERYYLRYQSYPATLDALVPEFIESIPIDWPYAMPPFYERTPSGRYKLWHVGWDGTNEDGLPPKKGAQKGDLSWIYEPIDSLPVATPGGSER